MANPTILKVFYTAGGSIGPFTPPCPAESQTSVLIRHTTEQEGGEPVYRTVAYLVGPAVSLASFTLGKEEATEWLVVVNLPEGIATVVEDIGKIWPPPSARIKPLDGTNPPPPPPGPVHGGNMQ